MELSINLQKNWITRLAFIAGRFISAKAVVVFATLLSITATTIAFMNDWIVRYGDSESHLNIAKRVVDSITPGFAQLGGIWLPIPHMLMLPFIWWDPMWHTGLAGSIVSGVAFIVTSVFLYKTGMLLLNNKYAAFAMAAVFMLNPNVLYMQSTPMTEILLLAFFTLSSYYFIKFLLGQNQLISIIIAGLFTFLAVLTRYEGWFLAGIEFGIIGLYYIPFRDLFAKVPGQGRIRNFYREFRLFFGSPAWQKMEGFVVIFITIAFFGVALWLLWDWLILGDPFYFTNSDFSARSQQEIWQSKGQLPAYHNLWMAFLYYFVTAMSNMGVLVYFPALLGFVLYFFAPKNSHRLLIGLLMATPFIFNVLTLFMGQSVIFIPHLTPYTFEHTIFNVRYGLMVIPLVAFGWAYLFRVVNVGAKLFLIGLFVFQFALYYVGYSQVISWQDGMTGLSAAIRPEAERWVKENYDSGLVLMDDYARTVSVVRSGIPMEHMIYIGNKPYWEESLVTPDKHVNWIVMQENDAVWKSLWMIPAHKARLTKNYDVVYKSREGVGPNITIFKKKPLVPVAHASDGEKSGAPKFWNFQCVDTMKYSRDAAGQFKTNPNDAFIDREVKLIADMGATCVSIGTPYDEEFVPVLAKWVGAARKHGLSVWFRGNMSGWEGWFNYPRFTSGDQHHPGVYNLITKHPDLFREGDIFTPAPEPENGILGDPRSSQSNREAFVKWLPLSYENCVKAFAHIKVAVDCGYYSFNGDVAREIIDKELLVKIGDVIVIDHYVREPERLAKDIQSLHKKLDSLVMLGEIGGPIPDIHGDMTPEEQADYMREVMEVLYKDRDSIIGLNYWVLRGGSTELVTDEGTKPAYDVMREYFEPGVVQGYIFDTLGKPIEGAAVKFPEHDYEVRTDSDGRYVASLPVNTKKLEMNISGYNGGGNRDLSLESGKVETFDFELDPQKKSLMYKLKVWWRNIF